MESDHADSGDAQATANRDLRPAKPVEACVICLEPISERAVAVPCNHASFDFICLVSWTQEHSQCPLCKVELTAVDYDFRAPDEFKTFLVSSTKPLQKPPSAPWRTTRLNQRRGFRRPQPYRRRHNGAAVEPPPDSAVSRRRYVYRHQLYSLHVGSNRLSHFKDFTPESFNRESKLQSRARTWIRRELQVFDFLTPDAQDEGVVGSCSHASSSTAPVDPARRKRRANNTEFILEYVVAILRTVDVKSSSGRAQALLADFLGEANARLFLHELEAWLRSPYERLEDWDRHVQYRETMLPEASGSSGGASGTRESHERGPFRDSEREDARQGYKRVYDD